MDAVLLDDLLDELVTLPEGRVFPPPIVVAVHHEAKHVLVRAQQLELRVPHLLEPLRLQLPHARLLYLLQSHRPGALQQGEKLVFFKIIEDVFLEDPLEFGDFEEVDDVQRFQSLTSADSEVQSVEAGEDGGEEVRLRGEGGTLRASGACRQP
jgi:hypothetical protein